MRAESMPEAEVEVAVAAAVVAAAVAVVARARPAARELAKATMQRVTTEAVAAV